jgi:hypothetical protein
VSRTLWTIVTLGFVAIVVLVVSFLVVFKAFRDSPSGSTAKVAVAIRGEFHLDSVGARMIPGAHSTALAIYYDTHTDSKFSVDVQNEEMKAVAIFAAGKLEPLDRRSVDEIRVHRSEVHGSGCWQRTYVSDLTVPNPLRGMPGIPSPFPPK